MQPSEIIEERSNNERTQLHPAWIAFISYCDRLGHGEIEKLKIQNGVPVLAEIAVQKVKFS